LNGKETVGLLLLTNSLEENWQVVMVVELEYVYFPCNFVLGTVFNRDGEITAIVETSELA
jgi:hypothetical protein